MEIVDAQVHLNMVGIDGGIVAMDAVGIDALVIDEFWSFDAEGRPQPGYVLPGGSFRHTSPLAELAVTTHPERFAYITRVQPDDPDIANIIGALRERPGRVALRLIPFVPVPPDQGESQENAAAVARFAESVRGPAFERYFSLAERHHVPVFLQVNGIGIRGNLGLVEYLLIKYPDLSLVLDHTGVALPGDRTKTRPARFEQFADVALLARFPNLSVKWGHAPRLSEEPYPYRDVQAALRRIVEAFGAERVMWASDWTIDLEWNSWADSFGYIREDSQLTDSDKEWILGRTVRTVLGWSAPVRKTSGPAR